MKDGNEHFAEADGIDRIPAATNGNQNVAIKPGEMP